MNPFAAQRRAFEHMLAGDFPAATGQFAKALTGFDNLLRDPQARRLVVERATLIPGYEAGAEEVAGQFLQALPGWLRELHFEGFCSALAKHALELARMHWRVLAKTAELSTLKKEIKLDLLQDQICLRFQVTQEAIAESLSERAEALQRAERILAADRDNKTARRMAISGYTTEIQTALERLSPAHKKTDPTSALDRLVAGKRQRLEVRLRKTVRRLRQHLRLGRGKTESDVEGMLFSYRQLCHYYIGIGELETAIRLTRRARRLRPADEELRRWARRVRQLRKRR